MNSVLSVSGLTKRYGEVQALAGIDLEVEKGEIFGFLGPNGAGKTTFTKCVTGFVRPNSGTVRIMGIDSVQSPHLAAPHVGLVPDQYDFYPTLTGRQHLEFYGRLLAMEREPRHARIEEVLELVGMSDRADRRVKGYSHGMKQRICIGQAILHKPSLIFFDEPTNGLDPKGAYELRQMIKALGADGTTVFLNSHLLNEVEEVCERVAIVDQGKLRTVDKVSELRKRFASAGQATVEVLNPTQKSADAIKRVIGRSPLRAANSYEFAADEAQLAEAVAAVATAGGRIVGVQRSKMSLEEVFLRVTGGDDE
jgi:ABC-2 type transport system ATP-binding protein